MIFLNEKYKKLAAPDTECLYFLQVGEPDERIFKIGTTNDLRRRMKEHERNYHKDIYILWFKPVKSKWTTLMKEEENKQFWRNNTNWDYIRNDRFIIPREVDKVEIKIRKKYEIPLSAMCYQI